MGGEYSTSGKDEKCILNFGRETWSEGPLGRPRRRWEDTIRLNLGKMGGKVRTGCIWLRIGTTGMILWTQ